MLRWGILGAAKIAIEQTLPALSVSSKNTITAIASTRQDNLTSVADRFGIKHRHQSYTELLNNSEVDAVYIPLPTSKHIEWSVLAANAGKHVLCEKPIAMKAREIDALIELSEKKKLQIAEALMIAHHPQLQLAKQTLDQGIIGELQHVEGVFTYYNTDSKIYKNNLELGGGGLRDIGVYPLAAARLVTGKEPLRAQSRIDLDPNFGTDRFAACQLDFDDFYLSFYCGTQHGARQEMLFHGDKGWIRLKCPFNPITSGLASVEISTQGYTKNVEQFFPADNQFQLQVDNFADAVAGEAELNYTLEASKANQMALDAIYASGQSEQQWIDISAFK